VSLPELAALILFWNVLVFGNGPVLVPLLQQHLVAERHVLSLDQLLFAFAVARVTPGQANLYVASIGYMLFGWLGAVTTTVAISLPGYLVLPLMRLYERFRAGARVRGFVHGLTAVSVGLILSATVEIGRTTLAGAAPWVVFGLALALLQLLRWPALAAVAGASAAGLALRVFS
jgi:chromate transporter